MWFDGQVTIQTLELLQGQHFVADWQWEAYRPGLKYVCENGCSPAPTVSPTDVPTKLATAAVAKCNRTKYAATVRANCDALQALCLKALAAANVTVRYQRLCHADSECQKFVSCVNRTLFSSGCSADVVVSKGVAALHHTCQQVSGMPDSCFTSLKESGCK